MDVATFNPETLFTPEHLANPYPTYELLTAAYATPSLIPRSRDAGP